jgi:hypothetical protein
MARPKIAGAKLQRIRLNLGKMVAAKKATDGHEFATTGF